MTAKNTLRLQIHLQGDWRTVGEVSLLGSEKQGLKAKAEFVYDLDYATEHAERCDYAAISCLKAVSFEPFDFNGWLPFLLDLFPQGAALQYVVDHYRIPDRGENYWRILKTAHLNPLGNIRAIADEGPSVSSNGSHPGFSREEVIAKGSEFLEYMVTNGAPVTGTTGAGGAAPKFLLREDHSGKFHSDGILADRDTKHCWLVKFPRGRKESDKNVLRSEGIYADIARELDITVQNAWWENDCLFIERFDRKIADHHIEFFGLESFYSLIGLPEFGSRLQHETYIKALARFSTDPQNDVIEYVLRDFMNVMFGNTDNHGRNSSVLKGEGWVKLAPLYDFAPMKFDEDGIVRNTRWQGKRENDIAAIAAFLEENSFASAETFQARLRDFYSRAIKIEKRLNTLHLPTEFVQGTQADRQRVMKDIERYLRNS